MLKQYAIIFSLSLCMTYNFIHSKEEALTCIQIIKGWIQCCCNALFPDELIEARDVCSIKKVQYYRNNRKITIHFISGYTLDLPNGSTEHQENLFKGVEHNFNKVTNKKGDHPYYYLAKHTLDNSLFIADDHDDYFVKKK